MAALLAVPVSANAQKYQNGLVDKTVAVVGNEMISLSQLEGEIMSMRLNGMYFSDRNVRCEQLEKMLESKLFLMQARVDSLTVNQEMVASQLSQHIDRVRTQLGGDEAMESYFGKPIYRLRQEWQQQFEDMSLTQQMQGEIARNIPDLTPHDVKEYIAETDPDDLPLVPVKYQLSQICIYPDREAANLAVKEKLLNIRERIINGEKFSTLARIYSEDPGSARKGGELGMASKSIFWPAFSDAAMSLKPGVISPDSGDSGRIPYHRGAREKGGYVQCETHPHQAFVHRPGQAEGFPHPGFTEDRDSEQGCHIPACGQVLFAGRADEDQRRTDGRPVYRLFIFRD